MSNLTLTQFKKLSITSVVKQMPIVVFSKNKPVYQVTSLDATPAPATAEPLDLLSLVLAARNDDGGDPVHRAEAQTVLSKWLAAQKTPTSTTPPVTTAPTPSTGFGKVSKPYWLGHEWIDNVKDHITGVLKNEVNNKDDAALFICYNIVNRDNGNYSSGGAATAADYLAWVSDMASAIGDRKAIIVLEPDAIGLSPNLNTAQQEERFYLLNKAVEAFKACKNVRVYLDSSIWSGADNSARLLNKVKGIDGFTCNVSGYMALKDCVEYAEKVSILTALHYLVDTSRNGNGAPHGADIWCNQTDTRIGLPNQMQPSEHCDAYLWMKVPGESDGLKINGKDGDGKPEVAPKPGVMWPEYRAAIYSGDWDAFKKKYNV